MNVFLFAVADPDLDLPSSSTTYVREKVSFPSGTNLTDVFIILSSTTFSHFPHLLSRGLNLVIFYGKLVDSDQNMSVSISDLTEHWDILLRDFSKIFHITFRIHRSQTNIPRQEVTKSPAFFNIFLSPPDRAAIHEAREGNEKGEFLPLSRSEWCALDKPINSVQFPINHF